MTAIGLVCHCPHCGGAVLIEPPHLAALPVGAADRDASAVPVPVLVQKNAAPPGAAVLVSTVSTSPVSALSTSPVITSTSTSTARAHVAQSLPLPLAEVRPAPTIWKRAIAIAYQVIEQWADGASQTDAFKQMCAEQGIDPMEAGTGGRPLYARALDWAIESKRKRQAGSR